MLCPLRSGAAGLERPGKDKPLTDTQRQPPGARPHLIHVGYAKSGSSFLRQWFAEHPQIGYCPGRFAGYAQLTELGETAEGVRIKVTSCENFASPIIAPGEKGRDTYLEAQATVCGNLAELFPAAHILIVTRGFQSMIMSSYSEYVRSGAVKSLEQLVASPRQENPWHYDAVIGMYRRRFGTDRVAILPWELLRDRPEEFIGRIEARFGLDHCPPSTQRVNRSLSPAEMRWYPRISAAIARAPVGSRLRQRLAGMTHRNGLSAVVRVLQRVSPAEAVSVDLLPAATIEAFRGKASCLAADPLFAPYAAEYLNDH
jgi:hypothetical protein